MALQFSAHAQQNLCGIKRRHTSTSAENSSMFTNFDWVDHVVADVTTNDAAAKVCSKPPEAKKVKVEQCLQEFFTNMLQSRGYPGSTHSTLDCGYNNKPTQHQTSSYGIAFTAAVRSSDLKRVKTFLFECGLNPNACNKFGESVVHVVCRRGNHTLLQVLLDAGCSVQVCDDFGRTPLHDACWTSEPNFKMISMLLNQDPWLLSLKDRRGSTPLGYVKYDSHCRQWINFLKQVADTYWPCLNNESLMDLKPASNPLPTIPPLALLEPNSRPIPDPKLISTLEVLEQVANGLQTPDSENCEVKKVVAVRRITYDSSKGSRLLSNACGQM